MKRFRLQFRFWLNITNDIENWLAAQIEALKGSRMFSKAIRVGLILFIDLNEQNVASLEEYFPFVREYYRAEFGYTPESLQFQGLVNAGTPVDAGSIFANEPTETGEEVRKNLATGMGDLFADDDDDLWN